MSGIRPSTDALTALLRTQLGQLRAQSAGTSTEAKGRQSKSPAPATRPPQDLAAALARRVAGIAPDDPLRRRKALRVFLESLLLDEWGSQLINDPGFHQLVSKVQDELEANPSMQPLIEEVVDRLLDTA